MSSWLIFNTLGLYPVAGQDVYLLGSPTVPDATLAVGNGKTLHIVARGSGAAGLNHYIQSATFNGKPLWTSWCWHGDMANGGELVLQMGSEHPLCGEKNSAAVSLGHRLLPLQPCCAPIEQEKTRSRSGQDASPYGSVVDI